MDEFMLLDWVPAEHRVSLIQDVLDALPDAYSDDLFEEKCGQVYEHVYGDGASKYASGPGARQ